MNNNNLVELMTQTRYCIFYSRNYEQHRKKIANIMNKNTGVTRTFDNTRVKVVNTFYSNHEKARGFNSKNKQTLIEKENDLILKKIIQVNSRRNQSLSGLPATARNYSQHNLHNLKKSLQTINSENQKLAQKLVSTDSSLRQQKMNESFKKHLERK